MRTFPLKTVLRAGLVALVVGAAGAVAAPAQAAHFGFSFGFGYPGQFAYSHPHLRHHLYPAYPYQYQYRLYRPAPVCQSDWQVRRSVEAAGYYRARIVARVGSRLELVARRGPFSYALSYDSCRGYITGVRRLYRS